MRGFASSARASLLLVSVVSFAAFASVGCGAAGESSGASAAETTTGATASSGNAKDDTASEQVATGSNAAASATAATGASQNEPASNDAGAGDAASPSAAPSDGIANANGDAGAATASGDCRVDACTDAQIAGILLAFDDASLNESSAASTRVSGDAATFVTNVQSTDRAAESRQNALFASAAITPVDGSISVNTRENADDVTSALATGSGDVAAAFADAEISLLQTAVATMDARLIPNVTSMDLATELTTMRGIYTDRIAAAKALLPDASANAGN